jgi:CHAT domain-containing protein
LKHSGKEVQAIAEITSARPSDIYVGERAREENVYRAQLEDARYMLFATHAVMPSEENGIQEPALALVPTTIGSFGATGADADGLLTASEVMNLKLSAELVVLSACNTAGSTMHGAGEGFVGLTRAFMFAGAKNLLVSHWPVESDSTRRLMVEVLRRNVKEQQRGDHALTEAKKWLRTLVVEHPEHASGKMSLSHPFFWAPFVWVGGY